MSSAPIYDDKAHVRGHLDLLSGAAWRRLVPAGADPDGPAGWIELAEIEHTDGVTYVVMRNSADPDGTVLTFTLAEWDAFRKGAADGEFAGTWD